MSQPLSSIHEKNYAVPYRDPADFLKGHLRTGDIGGCRYSDQFRVRPQSPAYVFRIQATIRCTSHHRDPDTFPFKTFQRTHHGIMLHR